MSGLWIKLLVCPTVMVLSTFLFSDMYYPYLYQPILVGLFLALAAHVMELFILRPGRFWVSNVMDFLAAFLIVYLSGFLFAGAIITWMSASLTAFFLAVTEYFQHLWLLRSGKTIKSA